MKRVPITPAVVRDAARLARYEIDEERANALTGAVQRMLQSLDSLDAVDLGETVPANAFDPRWAE